MLRVVILFLVETFSIWGDVNLSNGLVAHYEFEWNADDSLGNGNGGIEYGGVGYVNGIDISLFSNMFNKIEANRGFWTLCQ
jgi:hypothetical protein